jgi:hypothetical protein
VGFGSHSVFPLLLDHRDGQDDPAGRFLLADSEDGDVDVLRNGELAAYPRPGPRGSTPAAGITHAGVTWRPGEVFALITPFRDAR